MLDHAPGVCCADDSLMLERRAAAIGLQVDSLRQRWLGGSAAELLDKLEQWHAVGTQRVYLQVLDLSDLDHLREIAASVLPGASELR